MTASHKRGVTLTLHLFYPPSGTPLALHVQAEARSNWKCFLDTEAQLQFHLKARKAANIEALPKSVSVNVHITDCDGSFPVPKCNSVMAHAYEMWSAYSFI